MLDFYLLDDDENAPGYPEETGINIIGSIDFETFERLKAKRIIPERFDYHSDFRWDKVLIQQIRNNIQEHMLNDSDVGPLLQLLDIAKAHGSGLMAFAD
ncbi:hypothetical protein [Pedobacter hiemivivus]|uniref:Uncharacterized protein n=1 Tax=Pedobacter hiemivivus TaxID=2530454 RepID=A0A4R0NAR4_9SPHI|nr:hypothetical protein [Pedobacter hiemivivus]TCC97225.1 hypothetical protein EZ444_10265 [Pedobacter hiemivivus]